MRFIALFFVMFTAAGAARADMLVTPLRVVLDAKTRDATVEVINQSDRLIDIDAAWIDLSATADGGYDAANEDARRAVSARPYLRLSTASARIAPGRSMTLSISMADDATPPPGERRSHLLIEGTAATTTARQVSMTDMPVDIALGVSIPVILRQGGGRAPSAAISHAEFARAPDGALKLMATLERKGRFSPYGRVSALWRAAGDDSFREIGVLENIALYTELSERRIAMPLTEADLNGGRLELRYEGADEYAGRLFDVEVYEIEPRGGAE